ncbi:SH3 domain-containing protein [Pseudomonas sp. WHRI 8822A]|uniref:SH3 domain-containing protein n=1 Tax=Pseudomonas sp. WHRI 8822A TaxID=3162568 RepID=UPI0032EDEB97
MKPTGYRVVTAHRSEYPNPISFDAGTLLQLGERYDGLEDWQDWYFCRTDAHPGGWVPLSILEVLGNGSARAGALYRTYPDQRTAGCQPPPERLALVPARGQRRKRLGTGAEPGLCWPIKRKSILFKATQTAKIAALDFCPADHPCQRHPVACCHCCFWLSA